MKYFFDLVWLGNYIVPRWEALLLVCGFFILAALVAFGFLLVLVHVVRWALS